MYYKYIFVKLLLLIAQFAYAEISVTDNYGRVIDLPQPAQRIVSLSPHITENLFAIGAGEQVVGVASHSDYPPDALDIPVIGRHESLNIEAILALQPDLIIAWPEGNPQVQLERLEDLGIPVFYSAPEKLEEVGANLRLYGKLLARAEAVDVATAYAQQLEQLRIDYAGLSTVRVFYQLWHEPLLTVNHSQLIDQVIRLCGGVNRFSQQVEAIPHLSEESVIAVDPEVIITGQHGGDDRWTERWKKWQDLSATRHDQFYQVNEDLLYRPTIRLLDGAAEICTRLQEAREKRYRLNDNMEAQ
ncbi:MAG: cobalamin-binding protein [Amphritea sp.]